MVFDPNLPNSQQQDFESVLGAIRGNENNLNDRIKAQENLSLAATKNEVTAARGSRSTLNERLNVALDPQGNIKFDSLKNMTWIASGDVPTYVNAQSFTVPGDQTGKYLSGLVLRLMHGTTQIHSAVSVTSYTAETNKTTISLQQSLLTPALSSILIGLASLGEVLYEEALLKAIPSEPAWRTETEPCLFDLAVPGQPLDAPFVFSRPQTATTVDERGVDVEVPAGELRDLYDRQTGAYKGKLIEAYTSTNLVPYPTRATMWVNISLSSRINLGLDRSGLFNRIELGGTADWHRAGAAGQQVYAGEIWYVLLRYETGSSGRVRLTVRDNYQTGYEEHAQGPVGALQKSIYNSQQFDLAIVSQAEITKDVYECLCKVTVINDTYVAFYAGPQAADGIEQTVIIHGMQVTKSQPSSWIIKNDGAVTIRAADVLTIGPVESDTVFDQDFTTSINDVFPVNDCVISQDETHGLVVSSPTTGAVITGIDVPASWQGKRFRLLFNADNGYSRSFHFIGASGAKLGLRQINPGYAGDITIPYGTIQLHMRADSVPSNTNVHWANLKLTELVPFKEWDSEADGHTMLFQGDAFDNDAEIGLANLSDTSTNNAVRLARRKTPSNLNAYVVGNGTSTGPISTAIDPTETDILACVAWNDNGMRLGFDGSDIGQTLNAAPAGLSLIEFGKGAYITGKPITLRRIAFYNHKLSTADITAMVTK